MIHRGTPPELAQISRLNGGQGSVKILLPNGNSYTPGVTQHIMVQVSDPQQHRWGFQVSARLKSDPVNGQAGDGESFMDDLRPATPPSAWEPGRARPIPRERVARTLSMAWESGI